MTINGPHCELFFCSIFHSSLYLGSKCLLYTVDEKEMACGSQSGDPNKDKDIDGEMRTKG